jgi:hypothetical protein
VNELPGLKPVASNVFRKPTLQGVFIPELENSGFSARIHKCISTLANSQESNRTTFFKDMVSSDGV